MGLLSIIRKIKKKEKEMYTLNIWDVGGQKTIRSYWRNYFEQTDGLVWVVDSSDLRRLDDCKFELDNLLKEEVLNLKAMDKSRHWQIIGCSAYTGEGLLEGFDWLTLWIHCVTDMFQMDVPLLLFGECGASALMSAIYEENKDDDGFLYMTYSGENTFGSH
ncbi:ADP-ribosylation factor-like protein 2 [Gastrolobium bilobum]|uniref:ADP-ribosylation factor-like protein 2 n=1 Tax=Gastrolobium bilobum TaxID=150636 RepID=UPI002AAFD777|nr:ADP-ribosylation factor-like protein 2 [Gastrolobium bilobum]